MFTRKPFAAHGGKQEAHVNVIAKPKRKRDVPAVPKITDVSREKRSVEVFRCVDAKEITESNGKGAVAGKIKKQIKAVCIHIADEAPEARARRRGVEPVLPDQRSDYELVKESAKNALHCAINVGKEFSACSRSSPVACKTPIPVDRAGRNGRKEK